MKSVKTFNNTNSFLVSVIVPCFNMGQYIDETLDSVLNQTYENIEIILVNDGSTDKDTLNILGEINNSKIRVIHSENQGPSAARNLGILNSKGEFILPLDSDDLISVDYIKEALEVFSNKPKTKLVYSDAELFGEKKGFWNLPKYEYEKLLLRNMIFSAAIYRREDYNKTNGYNVNMRNGLEDWDFWLSLIKKDDNVYKIPKIHFYYRITNKSRNYGLDDENKKVERLYRQIYVNHKELYESMVNPIYSEFTRKKQISNCEHLLQEKNKEIHFMENSKFWKLRDFYVKIKNILS